MEDDNAIDIIKWLFEPNTKVDCSGNLFKLEDGVTSEWEAKLRGNLLALKPINMTEIPQLFVCEKVQLIKCVDKPASFYLKYGNEKTLFTSLSEDETEKWLIKLAICSHQMVQAELDQAMHQYQTQAIQQLSPIGSFKSFESNFLNYFLTSPFKKEHNFFIYQLVGVPNRKVVCREIMYESKFSLAIPLDMVKLSIHWASELRDDLINALWSARNCSILESLNAAVRHLNSNIEVYTQSIEFLDSYIGPAFRPSVEKFRIAFAAVPINLHVQFFEINGKPAGLFLTCGAVSAVPLRFANGGLYRMRNKFITGLDSMTLDFTNEYRFYTRRKTLLNIKRQICELTRRIDVEWHITSFGIIDKVGVQIFSEIKQLYEMLSDLIHSFPNISNLIDSLCENGDVQLLRSFLPDTLGNQLDSLEASIISLTSKMAVIDSINDDLKGRESFEESAKTALNFTLDALLNVVESVLKAQSLSLIVSCRKFSDCQSFFAIQLRHDLLLSQSVTIVTTALLTALQTYDIEGFTDCIWTLGYSPLISCFSFLSCYGDERGMIEDMFEIWSNFYNYVQFRFISSSSAVSQTCVPQIGGYRTDLKVSIPLNQSLYNKLLNASNFEVVSESSGNKWFRVKTIFWNIGVNYEATLACSIGDISLEETVNKTALTHFQQFVSKILNNSVQQNTQIDDILTSDVAKDQTKKSNEFAINHTLIHGMLSDLKKTVHTNASRKNIAIFSRVVALANALGGINIISCKSGKDRSSMAITLEEGRLLKETCGISQKQMCDIIDCLRRDGVRRENCRKNVKKALYSFSPFQIHFLPKEFRPPNGTFTQKVAS